MHTAELITLLRSHDRTQPNTRIHLAALDSTRRLHLLGELSNWLLAELQKYRDRQAEPTAIETSQQKYIRGQIRHTLLAIQVLLDSSEIDSKAPEDIKSKNVSSKTPALLDDKSKEGILERFLRPILIGMVPLGPRVDSTDIQLLCAKIICYCTNPAIKNTPFQPQILLDKLMTIGQRANQEKGLTKRDQNHNGRALQPDAIISLTALLQSPVIKLQDYGLRILTSHRSVIQIDRTWELLAPLKTVLEALKDNTVRITMDQQVEPFGQDPNVVPAGFELTKTSTRGDNSGGMIEEELERVITIQSKALTLLQWCLQEAGKTSTAPIRSSAALPASTQDPKSELDDRRDFSRKLGILKVAADVKLLAKLWEAIQHVLLFDGAKLASVSEKLVLLTSASIYWACWVFQEDALVYIILDATDTLMAWYGYYITPHDRAPRPLSSLSSQGSLPTSTTEEIAQRRTDIRLQSSVLEYISKLIQNIVTSRKRNPTLFVGNSPIGIVIMRRTIEFLEGILESNLPVTNVDFDPKSTLPISSADTLSNDFNSMNAISTTYPICIIKERPGVLEAMLGIMVGCYGSTQEASVLVLNSRLLHLLLLLLSNIQVLFATQNLAESTARKIQQLSLSMLLLILKHNSSIPGIDDVPIDHWSLGYQALVDLIMLPIEAEANAPHDRSAEPAAQTITSDEETGVKALRVFTLFWKHHTKGRTILSDLIAPRLHQLKMVPIVVGDQNIACKIEKWKRERTLLLLETIIYFGSESSVRINMRERWPSLLFLVGILGCCMRRLESNGYNSRDTLDRMIAKRCFLAMRNFWYDRLGLTRMIELNLPQSESLIWEEMMPPSAKYERQPNSLLSTASVVPLLIGILSPLNTNWSSELMLRSTGTTRRLRHPLFERGEQLLHEAALMLSQLSQFRECQERLVTRPGAIWMMSRMMVERSLVTDTASSNDAHDDGQSELLEKSLFEAMTRIMSAEDLAKSLVSNNTITELFAAIMEMDMPMYFYKSMSVFKGSISNQLSTAMAGETTNVEMEPNESQRMDSIGESEILPIMRQRELHRQLLHHFRAAMAPLRGQFERIYQYIGGHRSLQETNDSIETVYWLREYCALVFAYTLEPPQPNSVFWGSRVDRTALLNSESILGIICRMLTLELEYDVSSDDACKDTTTSVDHEQTSTVQHDDLENVQKEEALLRRFSAGLAIQSLCWRHIEEWHRQHLNLVQSYADVETAEWESYVAVLKGADKNGSVCGDDKLITPVDFVVQDRVISFPDRLVLSRTSDFFHTLLMGDYKEASQKHIRLHDVDPDDFELLMDVIKESQLTARLLLPEDLPLALVLRLMVCANRFMITFVKRLAEAWILDVLGTRELKYYDMRKQSQADVADVPIAQNNGKHHHQDPISIDRLQEKRQKLEHTDVKEYELADDADARDDVKDEKDEIEIDIVQDESEESIQESLLMVFEVCSNTRHGSLYSLTHPFHDLVWNVLKRIALRLGYVAAMPRFATMLNDGGEDRIQEVLQIFHDLIVNSIPTTT
ncbi:hypothetical protein BGZ46_004993 [Entomortierella lignicola]|nr:hypothetical protein BGZ46_004993 [Entomortierella lignicola]